MRIGLRAHANIINSHTEYTDNIGYHIMNINNNIGERIYQDRIRITTCSYVPHLWRAMVFMSPNIIRDIVITISSAQTLFSVPSAREISSFIIIMPHITNTGDIIMPYGAPALQR